MVPVYPPYRNASCTISICNHVNSFKRFPDAHYWHALYSLYEPNIVHRSHLMVKLKPKKIEIRSKVQGAFRSTSVVFMFGKKQFCEKKNLSDLNICIERSQSSIQLNFRNEKNKLSYIFWTFNLLNYVMNFVSTCFLVKKNK